jgi:polyhydroxyalkanoate synthesis regulator protein
MEDCCGNRVGHDVPACMFNDYKDKPDLFWLCEDFVVYPNKAMDDIVMVMLPVKVQIVGEKEGAKDATLLFPATTTDILLRQHFGIPLDAPGLASAILAFDIV